MNRPWSLLNLKLKVRCDVERIVWEEEEGKERNGKKGMMGREGKEKEEKSINKYM